MAVAGAGPARHRPAGPRDEALRAARTCYDHLAGRLGTSLADSLCRRGHVVVADEADGAAAITDQGTRFLRDELGIELAASGRRPLCRTCLDWSERRPHFAGRLGAALCRRFSELGWIEPSRDSRAVAITGAGRLRLSELFGIAAP
jgi:hypothetical protein